ncbi:MAG: DUF615 domain-containing protein [Halieaceae bacterium]|jgi:ribosome-associated protein|nr:DUF615 domain-containing protein [Halieaceae bacterium]
MPDNEGPNIEPANGIPSKSEMKRQMTALQEIGEALTRLTDKQLAKVPIIDERLVVAIRESRKINSNSAARRHRQWIGKLMRDIDTAPIIEALQSIHMQQEMSTRAFHEVEKLRDDALAAGIPGVELIKARWPSVDRQQLRQLLLQHQREMRSGKPPAASRKLFKLLRGLQESTTGEA